MHVASPTETPPAVPLLVTEADRRLPVPPHPRRHARSRSTCSLPGPIDARPVPDRASSTPATTRRTPTAPQPRHAHRADARLRDRRREHARHRLLGRRVAATSRRCSRSTATTSSRRSPRSRGSRTARSAWSASRTPASAQLFVAATAAAAPRRDHAALGDRRHVPRRAVPGRHLQRRLRARVGEGARRPTPRPGGPGLGEASASTTATRPAPRTRRCACRRRACSARSHSYRYYDPAVARPARAVTRSSNQIQVPDLPRRRVAGRADRRPLPGHARRLPGRTSPRKFTLTNGDPLRLARSRRDHRAGSSSSTSTSPHRDPAHLAAVTRQPRRSCTRAIVGVSGLQLPPDRFDGFTNYDAALAQLRGRAAGARAVRQRGRRAARRPRARVRGRLRVVAGAGHRTDRLLPRARRRR